MELFDPTSSPKVADINTVASDFRWMYKQDGDSHVLDAENPSVKSSLSVISGLKGTLTRVRGDLKNAQGQNIDLTPLKDFGATPAEIAEAFNAKIALLDETIKGSNKDKIREGVQKELQPKITAAEARAKTLSDQLFKHLVVGEASQAIAIEKGVPTLLMPFVQQQVKVMEVGGEFQVHVVDGQGETRFNGANRMSVADLVKEMKADKQYGRLFESEAPQGSGTKPGTMNRPGNTAAAAAAARQGEMSSTQKISAGLKKLGR